MAIELKPCPICGGAAIIDDVSNFLGKTRWSPACQTEDCLLWNANYATQREAIAAWNTRAPSRTEAEVVAEITAPPPSPRGTAPGDREMKMTDKDVIDMAQRSVEEIQILRSQIDRLAPKAHAYDMITAILDLLPKPSQGYGEDLVWQLKKQIDELRAVPVEEPTP